MQEAQHKTTITVDLEQQKIISASGKIEFDIEPARKNCLLNGLDDIELTLQKTDLIKEFEAKQSAQQPWV